MAFVLCARRFRRVILAALLALLSPGGALLAQQRPAEITPAQAAELPYILSGRLNITFGTDHYFGTATYIRRYTGLTAGHMLYDPKGGFATDPYYEPALYGVATSEIPVDFFAVLSGYQSAAEGDPNSNAAFAYDMGYVLFSQPAEGALWASFGDDPNALTMSSDMLVFGYAAESFPGVEQASVHIGVPFYQLQAPALYENTSYYTEEGMSGGPLYVSSGGVMQIAAVTVAGTDPPETALSDVRAITPTEYTLFTEAEYVHGLITSGTIHGPVTVAPGGSVKYKTGVVFADGAQERRDLPARYDELTLQVQGRHKNKVKITKLKTSKFQVEFAAGLQNGTVITLALLRTTADATQTPLQTMTITMQSP